MSRCLITADLHLGHSKIISFEPARRIFSSIEEHDAEIERRWRETVRKGDVVYVLGDVAWNRRGLERFRSFPGIKKLVMGNHDKHDMRAYLEAFRKVSAYAEIDGWLLAHIPLHPSSVRPRFKGQIHGHTHGHGPAVDVLGTVGGCAARYVSACVEMHDFRPVVFEELVS